MMEVSTAIQAVRAYHRLTKHHFHAYAPGPAFLDWDTQPNPYRRFVGAPTVALPLAHETGPVMPYDALYASAARVPEPFTLESLGLFMELALGLSAWKSFGPDRWALRNNPSSGNLHPTEGYLLLWRAVSPDLGPGLYHYAPYEHALERRAVLPEGEAARLCAAHLGSFGALGLSSVVWREAWKYGARAYRYVQLDVGHALASSRFAASVMGWALSCDVTPGDDMVAACLGIDREADFELAEREHPDLLAVLGTSDGAVGGVDWGRIAHSLAEWRGTANRLGAEYVEWPQIEQVLPAVHKSDEISRPFRAAPRRTSSALRSTDAPDACAIIRQRRSAQRMDGRTGLPRAVFERMLKRTLTLAQAPFDALPFPPAIQLLLFVHAVEGLEPGLYLLARTEDGGEAFHRACAGEGVGWDAVAGSQLPLYRLNAPLDLRRAASQLCCRQAIAGHGAFSLGMLANLDRAFENEGAWAYRRLYWEAGTIGQTLYLEAEAAGLSGTGIGCFFDDEVHRLLGLAEEGAWQSLYHFTVGKALIDTRLVSEPPYAHLESGRAPE
ncbi:MAG: SagB/ThcOx family dehydrogenase [Pseudomonadota bacterium]